MKKIRHKTRLAFYRKQINLVKLYTYDFKTKIFKYFIIAVLSLIILQLFYNSFRDTETKTVVAFLNDNSQLINLILSFLLFLTTGTYVFLTYKYVSLTKAIISENSKQRVYEIRPQMYFELFTYKVTKIIDPNKEDDTSSDFSRVSDKFIIDFTITIHCYGKGPAIFTKLEVIIPTDNNRYSSTFINHESNGLKDTLPENMQPLSKVNLNISLRTNVTDLNSIRGELLEMNLTFKDITGNDYEHKLFYGGTFYSNDNYGNYFDLEHESIKFNGKIFYVKDRDYLYQKLNYPS